MASELASEVGDKTLTAGDILSALGDEGEEAKSSEELSLGESNDKEESTDLNDEDGSEEASEEDEDEDSEESDDEKAEKLKLTETEDEELSIATIPKRKEILAKFPELFKTFPGIEHALHREIQYAEIFPTLREAKAAGEELKEYNSIKGELFSGSIDGVLTALKKADSKAYAKITDNIVETIGKIDPAAQVGIFNKVTKNLLKYAFDKGSKGKTKDDEQLALAAQIIHNHLYDTEEVTGFDNSKNEVKEDPREAELKTREENFNKQQFNIALTDVSDRINKVLANAVTKNIDPKGSMSDYIKGKAVEDVLKELDKVMGSDTRFRSVIDNLWLSAKKSNFAKSDLDRIYKALAGKAQSELMPLIRKVRASALKSGSASVRKKDKDETVSRNENRSRDDRNGNRSSMSRSEGDRNLPRPGESARDFLMRD